MFAAKILKVLARDKQHFRVFQRRSCGRIVGLKVIAVVGSRLRRLVGIIEELSFTTVRQRLIALILRLAQASHTRSKEGIHVELTKSHQDLAAELGTVRELVSRNLSRLQAEGYLDVEGRKIVVKDLPGLKREQTSAE